MGISNIFKLKVFQNKNNGQMTVTLPKRFMSANPQIVKVKIPKKCMQKEHKTEWNGEWK